MTDLIVPTDAATHSVLVEEIDRDTLATTMQINGSIPFHVARAYGVQPTRAVTPSAATPSVSAPPTESGLTQTTSARAPDGREPSEGENIQRLVAARVDAPVDFAGERTSSRLPGANAHTGAFPLYTRAADRIEAAVGIQIGRSIDVKG